jgi:hypothetical protein
MATDTRSTPTRAASTPPMAFAACGRCGVSESMGRPGPGLDNAAIESWHSTLEFELRRLEHFATKATTLSPAMSMGPL